MLLPEMLVLALPFPWAGVGVVIGQARGWMAWRIIQQIVVLYFKHCAKFCAEDFRGGKYSVSVWGVRTS